MRELMRGSLARSLRTLADEDRLAAALPVVCGSAMAAQCTVERLDEGRTLHLRVRETWLPSMLSMREVLQHDLQRVSGVALGGLWLETDEVARAPRKPPMRVTVAEAGNMRRRAGK